MQRNIVEVETHLDRLESGPRLAGRLGSGVRVSATVPVFKFSLFSHFACSNIHTSADLYI